MLVNFQMRTKNKIKYILPLTVPFAVSHGFGRETSEDMLSLTETQKLFYQRIPNIMLELT